MLQRERAPSSLIIETLIIKRAGIHQHRREIGDGARARPHIAVAVTAVSPTRARRNSTLRQLAETAATRLPAESARGRERGRGKGDVRAK